MQLFSPADVDADILPAQVCFRDQAEFCAAVTDLVSFSFNGCNADPEFTEYPGGLTVQGVRFFVSCDADFPTSVLVYSSDTCGKTAEGRPVLYAGGAKALHVTVPAGTTAFGADFPKSSLDPEAALQVSVNNETFLIPAPHARQLGSVFAGFLGSIPITQISIRSSDAGPVLSRVYYGRA